MTDDLFEAWRLMQSALVEVALSNEYGGLIAADCFVMDHLGAGTGCFYFDAEMKAAVSTITFPKWRMTINLSYWLKQTPERRLEIVLDGLKHRDWITKAYQKKGLEPGSIKTAELLPEYVGRYFHFPEGGQ